VASLRTISDQLEKGQGTAGMLLHDDKLYNNLNQTSSEVVKLLYDFRQNPKKYLTIKLTIF
jgi:phospholipid/cholesterol/gamma-HCH transport system substrate-binding protein